MTRLSTRPFRLAMESYGMAGDDIGRLLRYGGSATRLSMLDNSIGLTDDEADILGDAMVRIRKAAGAYGFRVRVLVSGTVIVYRPGSAPIVIPAKPFSVAQLARRMPC